MNKLLKCISIILLFFSCEEKIIEKAKSMNRFYTPEQEKEYGVVGIKIEVIK